MADFYVLELPKVTVHIISGKVNFLICKVGIVILPLQCGYENYINSFQSTAAKCYTF